MQAERDLITQAQENERSGHSYIKGIADKVGQSGKAYKELELGDGTKLRFFDAKAVEGLQVGAEINYSMRKNERGFWNPTSIAPALSENGTKSEVAPLEAPRGVERFDRDRQILSMNSMTNAVNLYTAMLPYLESKPARMSQALEMVFKTHSEIMSKHDTPANGA